MAREKRLTEEERALLRAQTAAIPQQTAQAAADTEAKMRIAMQQLEAERAMATEKLGLGREEIGGRNQQAQLAAAIGLLDTGAKERIARQGAQETIASDLAKRGDIPQNVLATALAESGQPGLYNALQQEEVKKREQAINQMVPALRSASSDAEREKNFKPALDALGPDVYQRALAMAFPKDENASVREPIQPTRFQMPTTTGGGAGVDYSGLVGTLLGKSGVIEPAGGTRAPQVGAGGFPVLPNTPETRYVPSGAGSLEGSTPVAGGIRTPSGGFIGGTLGADRLAKLITSQNAAMPTVASNEIPNTGPATLPAFESLLAGTPAGSPRQTPVVGEVPLIPPQLVANTVPGPRPADINVDAILSGLVGNPTMEDLRRRQQAVRY